MQGAYRDDDGKPVVLKCVREAERRVAGSKNMECAAAAAVQCPCIAVRVCDPMPLTILSLLSHGLLHVSATLYSATGCNRV